MDYELISEEDYAGLSEDSEKCFVEFEGICRRNMNKILDNNSSTDLDRAIREQYMAAVSAVAQECGVAGISYNPEAESFWQEHANFNYSVQGEVARVRIRQRGARHPYSVLLTSSTRTKVEHYVARIRDLVENSDMDHDRKIRLNEKLDQLIAELSKQRLSFGKTMAILATATAIVAGVTTIAADGQNAISNIMKLIGQDKESEESAERRLSPPVKALPAPVRRTASVHPARSYDLDDDIPF